MKHLLSLALASVFASIALAQSYVPRGPGAYTILTGGTNVIAASTTNTPGNTFDVSEYGTVDIQVTLKASTTNVTPVTFYFSKSLDSTTYETTPSLSAAITPNGTAEVSKVYTFAVPGAATLKLSHAANTEPGSYVTNVAIKYRTKTTKVQTR